MFVGYFARRSARARGKALWALLLRASGLLGLARRYVQRRGIIVLTFHRVLNDQELQQTASLPGMIVRVTTFDQFLQYATEHCRLVDLSQDVDWSRDAKLRIAMTFDDGWCDNATSAFPVIRKHRAPMAIFVVPKRTGESLPFWPELAAAVLGLSARGADRTQARHYIEEVIEGLKSLPAPERQITVDRMILAQARSSSKASVDRTLTWEQITQLQARGVTFGSHTSTHEILTCIPVAQAEDEIATSRHLIEEKLRTSCFLFSYPNGNCSPAIRNLVVRAGYRFAFLNQKPGVWMRECDPYLVPRVNVCEYHLVDTRGSFSPTMFEYAVIWKAARGLLWEFGARFLADLWWKLSRGLVGKTRRESSHGGKSFNGR